MYYYIQPFSCEGQITGKEGNLDLVLLNDEINSNFIELSFGGYIISNVLLQELWNNKITGFKTKGISRFDMPSHLSNSIERFKSKKYSLIEFGNTTDTDIFLWENRLLVISFQVLKILKAGGGFDIEILGSPYGKEFEIVTNLFFIGRDIEGYFQNQFESDLEFVELKRMNAANEGRRRRGKNPLL